MCGICGAFFTRTNQSVDAGLITAMCNSIVHRGPDDEGSFINGPIGLGMRRLSIINLETGAQPIFNEDKSVCLIVNGEIYNFRELRSGLELQGHIFASNSDSEVLVHLYEQYGLDFVGHLNGMFAIALYDISRKRLVLARDRLGQKPLYYAWTDDGLVFGSELKCLMQFSDLSFDLEPSSVYHYFTLGYIPHPQSIYQSVFQLPPASRMVVENGQMRIDQYWNLNNNVDAGQDLESACEQVRELLDDATRLRMISDVPIGAFLSGGLDSSICVALMARHSGASRVKTFHIDFGDERSSEKEYARSVAKRFDTEHIELTVVPSAAEILDHIVEHFDEPFGDASAVPTYYVSQLTRQFVTVALAGDGGDESFGGYVNYRRILARRNLPAVIRLSLGLLGNSVSAFQSPGARGSRYFRSLGMDHHQFFAVGTEELETRELLTKEFLESTSGASTFELIRKDLPRNRLKDPLAAFTRLDTLRYLPDDILTKVDRMSMANSLEARSPFLDHRVVELAASFPYDWKIKNNSSKVILKKAFAKELPAEVLQTRKRGFSMPLEHWFRNELRDDLKQALYDKEIEASGVINMAVIRRMANEHFTAQRERSQLLWRYLFFVRWWNHWKQIQNRTYTSRPENSWQPVAMTQKNRRCE